MKNDKRLNAPTYQYSWFLAPLIAVSIYAAGVWYGGKLHYWKQIDNPGVFGDMFGFLNTLFAGLAFVGLFFNLKFNAQQLATQQEELKIAQDAAERQKQELMEQGKSLKSQQFESNYFRILEMLLSMTNSLYLSIHHFAGREADYKGQMVFKGLREEIDLRHANEVRHADAKNDFKTAVTHFNGVYATYGEAILSPRFKLIELLLVTIRDAKMANHDFYLRPLTAMLTQNELVLLSYFSASNHVDESWKEFVELIEEFKLIENLPLSQRYVQ